METKVLQIRARGTLTLPARLRERYALEDGDPLTLVDLDGLILLVPKVGVVEKLAGEIERLSSEAGLSVDELVSGVGEERATYYAQRIGRSR
ncbi:MAG TPA: AbrB/MazE/SpoVT family DNA-binding domain-containing protein [Actinomycetota bacterium]